MRTYTLSAETLLDAPIEKVFDFFSRAENLERITPPFLHFQIITPLPIEMRQGLLIDYKLKLRGVPMKWQTEITVWEPNVRFVDSQLKGPYRKWVHEHRFLAEGTQTRMWDQIEYALPGGPLGSLVHALFVRREVEGIFDYRAEALRSVSL